MSSDIKPISDNTFLTEFENLTLDPLYFNHLGHLRLAWLYLTSNGVETAVNKVCSGIQRYAQHLGATQKFHVTITDAMVRIMAKRMAFKAAENWQTFLQQNVDLVEDAQALLHQHYSVDILINDRSRLMLIQPDLKPI